MVVIVSAILFLGSTFLGYSRGFLKTAFSMLQIGIALALVATLNPIVSEIVMENTSIYEQTKQVIEEAVEEKLEEQLTSASAMTAELQSQLIDEWCPIEAVRELLKQQNTTTVYESLGVSSFSAFVGAYLAQLVVYAISFVFTFLVVLMALQVLSVMLSVVGHLPVIGGINRLAGGVLGAIRGVLILWVLGMLATAMSGTTLGQEVLQTISETPVLSIIYNSNWLLELVLGMLPSL